MFVATSIIKIRTLNKDVLGSEWTLTSRALRLHGPNYPDITDLGISTEGVEKLLSNLNVSKASGSDLISCDLLKGLAEEIVPIFAEIFRQSLHDGVITSIWKNADPSF